MFYLRRIRLLKRRNLKQPDLHLPHLHHHHRHHLLLLLHQNLQSRRDLHHKNRGIQMRFKAKERISKTCLLDQTVITSTIMCSEMIRSGDLIKTKSQLINKRLKMDKKMFGNQVRCQQKIDLKIRICRMFKNLQEMNKTF